VVLKPSLGRQNLCSAASCGGSDWWWVCACVLQRHAPHCLCNATAGVTTTSTSSCCTITELCNARHTEQGGKCGRPCLGRCMNTVVGQGDDVDVVVTPAVAKQTPVVWHAMAPSLPPLSRSKPLLSGTARAPLPPLSRSKTLLSGTATTKVSSLPLLLSGTAYYAF